MREMAIILAMPGVARPTIVAARSAEAATSANTGTAKRKMRAKSLRAAR
jgi:hypothetical protein